jgi:hypothetical protein
VPFLGQSRSLDGRDHRLTFVVSPVAAELPDLTAGLVGHILASIEKSSI